MAQKSQSQQSRFSFCYFFFCDLREMREWLDPPGAGKVLVLLPFEGLSQTDLPSALPAATRVDRPLPFEGFYERTRAARSGESVAS